jgi:hypothetical protein
MQTNMLHGASGSSGDYLQDHIGPTNTLSGLSPGAYKEAHPFPALAFETPAVQPFSAMPTFEDGGQESAPSSNPATPVVDPGRTQSPALTSSQNSDSSSAERSDAGIGRTPPVLSQRYDDICP